MKFIMMIMASLALGLGACKSMGGGDTSPAQNSLKGVYDSQYVLRLVPIGSYGIFKFEVCASKGFGVAEPGSCVDAFRTNTQENLLLTLEAVESMKMTDRHHEELLGLHHEYKEYQDALASRSQDLAVGGGTIGGIVIAAGLGAHNLHSKANAAMQKLPKARLSAQQAAQQAAMSPDQKVVQNMTRLEEVQGLLAQVQGDQKTIADLGQESAEELAKLQNIEVQIAKQKGILSGFDEVQARLGLSSLGDMYDETVRINQRFAVLDITPQKAAEPLTTAAELGGRKTLLSSKFVDFVIEDLGVQKTPEVLEAMNSFGFNPTNIKPELYQKWIAQGGSIDQIIEPQFLYKLFQYNKIENVLLPQSAIMEGPAGVSTSLKNQLFSPTNVEELTAAFQRGDYRFFRQAFEFIQTGGTPPTAKALFTKLQGYNSVLPKNQIILSQLQKEAKAVVTNRAKLAGQITELEEGIAAKLGQLGDESQAVRATRGASGAQMQQEAVQRLSKEADQLVKTIKFAPKGIAALVMLAAGGIGAIAYVTGDKHIVSHKNAESIIDKFDQLQVLLQANSPLLSVDSVYNAPLTSGSTVENILYSFGMWQSTSWVDAENTGIVITQFCLPKLSPLDNQIVAKCKMLNSRT